MQFYNLSWDSNHLWFHAHACLKCSCNHGKSKRTIKFALVVWLYLLFSLQHSLILCFLPRLFLLVQLQLGQMMGKDKKTGNHNDLTTHLAFLPMIEDKMQQAAWKKISAFSWVFCLCAAAAAESGLIYKSHWCHLSGIVLGFFFFPQCCRWRLAGVSKWQMFGGKAVKSAFESSKWIAAYHTGLDQKNIFILSSMFETFKSF